MAATVTLKEDRIVLTVIDADWTFSKATYGLKKFKAIRFFPGAADDVLVVKDKTDSGDAVTDLLSSDGEGRQDKDIDPNCVPMVDFSACTLSAGHRAEFVFK